MTQPEPHPTSVLAGFLSYLVPGLGQIYQGRVGKGVLFFVCLISLFHVGQAMGNWQNVYLPPTVPDWAREREGGPRNNLITSLVNRWHYPGQFFIGIAAWPALWHFFDMPGLDNEAPTFWSTYQKAPNETRVNEFLVNSDKTPDLGLMYTVIAGVLNILVIYDAYAGPAFPPRSKKPQSDPAKANVEAAAS